MSRGFQLVLPSTQQPLFINWLSEKVFLFLFFLFLMFYFYFLSDSRWPSTDTAMRHSLLCRIKKSAATKLIIIFISHLLMPDSREKHFCLLSIGVHCEKELPNSTQISASVKSDTSEKSNQRIRGKNIQFHLHSCDWQITARIDRVHFHFEFLIQNYDLFLPSNKYVAMLCLLSRAHEKKMRRWKTIASFHSNLHTFVCTCVWMSFIVALLCRRHFLLIRFDCFVPVLILQSFVVVWTWKIAFISWKQIDFEMQPFCAILFEC